jgi:LysM repeat protein
VGRLYNIAPNQAASFNGTSISRGLVIGETLRIPMTPANFTQDGTAGADEVLVPVYHTVKEKEGLYRVSQNYNKVPLEQLRRMNNLSSDDISVGTSLVVGYLKVKKDLSPLASAGKAASATRPVAQAANPPKEKPAPAAAKTEKETPPTAKTEPPPAPKPVTRQQPANTSGGAQSISGGAFRGLFEEQVKGASPSTIITGTVAAFKSTSGWQDGKYYILMNKVVPGTVMRVTNPENGRIIYAKVLGEVPPMKENEGLTARISNAAAAELGLGEGRFDVQLAWTVQ